MVAHEGFFELLHIDKHFLNMLENHIIERYVTDIVRGTRSEVTAVVGTSEEILSFLKSIGRAIVKLSTAIGTVHLPGKDTHLSRRSRSAAVCPYLLNIFKAVIRNYGGMSIQEHHLLVTRIVNTLLALVIFRSRFEINGVTYIRLVLKNTNYRGLCPLDRITLIKLSFLLSIVRIRN